MLSSFLRESYLQVLNTHFAVSAALLPDSPCVELGDYGYYLHGRFIKRGNLFREHELSPEYCLISEPHEQANQFLISPHASGPVAQGRVSHQGKLYTRVSLVCEGETGFFLHLTEVRNELFFPDKKVETLIQALVRQKKWDEEYRLVWQRFVSDSTRFGYIGAGGGKVQFMADECGIFHGFEDCELIPEFSGCVNTYLDHWLTPFPFTPAVNFTRVRTFEETCMGDLDGFWQEELSAMGAVNLVLDNGFSTL